MATLTYDSTPADQPEFNEAEQEALAIGEQAEAEQQQLLAGKFRDPEALEKAYIELQSKLGEPRESNDVPEVQEGEDEVPVSEDNEEVPDFNQEDVDDLTGIAGGEERYNEMLLWAAENLSKDDIAMFDSVIDSGNKDACFFAINALNQRYTDAVGSEQPLLTGRGSRETMDVFRSQAEVVAAMKDPKYDSDPAYRQDVFAKLERSQIQY